MSKFNCKCGGLILPDYEALAIGHQVNFSIQERKNGYGHKIIVDHKHYTGEITAIDQDRITVKTRVRTFDLYRYDLTPANAPRVADYLRVGKCLCNTSNLKRSA